MKPGHFVHSYRKISDKSHEIPISSWLNDPFPMVFSGMPKRFGGSPAENVKGQGSKSQDSGHDTNHLSDLAMIMNG